MIYVPKMRKKPTYEELEQRVKHLERSETRFYELVEGSIQGVMVHRGYQPLYINGAWAAIHGYTTEEVLSMKSILPLIVPGDRARMTRYEDDCLNGQNVVACHEYRGIRKDGSEIWLESRTMLIQWDLKYALQSTIVDISDRKLA